MTRYTVSLLLLALLLAACGPTPPTVVPQATLTPQPPTLTPVMPTVLPTVPDRTPSPVAHSGAWVYFLSDRGGRVDLWRVDPNGGTPEQVTDDADEERWPAISRDGRFLAYVAVTPDGQKIRLLELATGAVQMVAGGSSLEQLTWLADGSLLYADRGSGDSGLDLFRIPAGGAATPFLARTAENDPSILSWSAVDGWLVVQRGVLDEGGSELCYGPLGADGSLGELTCRGDGFNPHFSPDGRFLAFQSPPDDEDPIGYILEIAAGSFSTYNLNNELRRWDHDLAWSPDSSQLVFCRSSWTWLGPDGRPMYAGATADPAASGKKEGLYLLGVPSMSQHPLTTVGYDGAPTWSPDGQRVLFTSNRDDFQHSAIWIWDVTTGEAQALPGSEGNSWAPQWWSP